MNGHPSCYPFSPISYCSCSIHPISCCSCSRRTHGCDSWSSEETCSSAPCMLSWGQWFSLSPPWQRGGRAKYSGMLQVQEISCCAPWIGPKPACGVIKCSATKKFLSETGTLLWEIHHLCSTTNRVILWTQAFCSAIRAYMVLKSSMCKNIKMYTTSHTALYDEDNMEKRERRAHNPFFLHAWPQMLLSLLKKKNLSKHSTLTSVYY